MLTVNHFSGFGAGGDDSDPFWAYVTSLGQPLASDATYTADARGNSISYAAGAGLNSTSLVAGCKSIQIGTPPSSFTVGSALFASGSSDFFFETKLRFSALPSSGFATILHVNGSTDSYAYMRYDGTTLAFGPRGGAGPGLAANVALSAGPVYDLAVGRHLDGSTYNAFLFVNGAVVGAITDAFWNFASGPMKFGEWDNAEQFPFAGWIGPWRLTVGACRHVETYAPSTGPWPTN
jgi:hypothetical protein